MVDIGGELLVHLSMMPVSTKNKADAEMQTDDVTIMPVSTKNTADAEMQTDDVIVETHNCRCELPLQSSSSTQSNEPLPSSQSNKPAPTNQSNEPPLSSKIYPGDFFKSEMWKNSTFGLDDDFELDF